MRILIELHCLQFSYEANYLKWLQLLIASKAAVALEKPWETYAKKLFVTLLTSFRRLLSFSEPEVPKAKEADAESKSLGLGRFGLL